MCMLACWFGNQGVAYNPDEAVSLTESAWAKRI